MKINTELGVALLDSSSEPPPILYKYLSETQVENVLENGSVRFTSLSNTNDLFEVRAIFKKFVGPKLFKVLKLTMRDQLKEDSLNKTVDTVLNDSIKKHGITSPIQQQIFKKSMSPELKINIKREAFRLMKLMPSFFSDDDYKKMFFNSIKKMLCFSLSEEPDIAPMWAHYANNHKGFVIAFDTESSWFKEKKDGTQNRLRKVNYFDGLLEEALDDIEKVISSKTMDWAYEREWRVYSGESRVDSIKQNPEEPIHLVNFPPEAVQRIILGEKMKPDVQNKIKEIVSAKYPHAEIYRMQSDSLSTTMNEIKN